MTEKIMDKKIVGEDLWCEYSDLPSPLAYTKSMDYDSTSPKSKTKKEKLLKTVFKKIIGVIKIW